MNMRERGAKNGGNQDDYLQPERPEAAEEADMAHQQQEQTQQILETGSVTPTKGKYTIHCLTIVGQVEGHYILSPQNKTTKYEHVIPQLVSIQENSDIEGMLVMLNTVGGDVEAGLAIAELISGMRKPTVSLVLGGGHSIGVPLAVSADVSFIAPSATMTLHPVRMNGTVLGVPQTMSYFEKMQDRIVGFVEENSNINPKRFRQMMMNTGELVMDMGTVLTGKQAVEVGLIDRVGGLSDAIECLYGLIEESREHREKQEREKELGQIENIDEIADPIQYAKRRKAQAEGRGAQRKGNRRAAHIRRGAAAGTAGGQTATGARTSREIDYSHGRPNTPGDTDPAVGPEFPPQRRRNTNGTATGAERQNQPPQADFPQLGRSKSRGGEHNMKYRDPGYAYGGETPPDMNPFGHPGRETT